MATRRQSPSGVQGPSICVRARVRIAPESASRPRPHRVNAGKSCAMAMCVAASAIARSHRAIARTGAGGRDLAGARALPASRPAHATPTRIDGRPRVRVVSAGDRSGRPPQARMPRSGVLQTGLPQVGPRRAEQAADRRGPGERASNPCAPVDAAPHDASPQQACAHQADGGRVDGALQRCRPPFPAGFADAWAGGHNRARHTGIPRAPQRSNAT